MYQLVSKQNYIEKNTLFIFKSIIFVFSHTVCALRASLSNQVDYLPVQARIDPGLDSSAHTFFKLNIFGNVRENFFLRLTI